MFSCYDCNGRVPHLGAGSSLMQLPMKVDRLHVPLHCLAFSSFHLPAQSFIFAAAASPCLGHPGWRRPEQKKTSRTQALKTLHDHKLLMVFPYLQQVNVKVVTSYATRSFTGSPYARGKVWITGRTRRSESFRTPQNPTRPLHGSNRRRDGPPW